MVPQLSCQGRCIPIVGAHYSSALGYVLKGQTLRVMGACFQGLERLLQPSLATGKAAGAGEGQQQQLWVVGMG